MLITELTVFLLAPLALALWLDVRVGERRPTDLRVLGLATLSAMLLCSSVGEPLDRAVGAVAEGRPALALFVALSCAFLTWGFLAGLWMVRVAAAVASQLRR